MKILAIEDDPQVRKLLSVALGSRGWSVIEAASAFEGEQAVIGSKPDVVLLDLNLPDGHGSALLARIRSWSAVPVVVVSVLGGKDDIVSLLEAGADDYVVKPFHIEVLIARIEAVKRRTMPEAKIAFESRGFRFDSESREVSVEDEAVRLTPTEYAILSILVQNAGKIVTRSHLLSEVWGPSGENEDGNLRVQILSLRKKLERDPSSPSLIITEPGIGYRLAVD